MLKCLTLALAFGLFCQVVTAQQLGYNEIYRIYTSGHLSPISEISPNGRYVISIEQTEDSNHPRQIRVDDLLMRRKVCTSSGDGAYYSSYSSPFISPKGDLIVAIAYRFSEPITKPPVESLMVYNLKNCERVKEFWISEGPDENYFKKIIFSNDGTNIAILESRRVQLFDISDRGFIKEWAKVNNAAFSKNGNFIFIGEDEKFSTYDLNGKLVNRYAIPGYSGLAYDHGELQSGNLDNEMIFFGSKNDNCNCISKLNINKFDLTSNSVLELAADIEGIMPVNYVFSRNLKSFISNSTTSGTLKVFNFENKSVSKFTIPNKNRMEYLTTNYNDTLVAAKLTPEYLAPSSKLVVMDLKTGEIVAEIEEKNQYINDFKFSPTSNQLIYSLESTPEIRVIQFEQ